MNHRCVFLALFALLLVSCGNTRFQPEPDGVHPHLTADDALWAGAHLGGQLKHLSCWKNRRMPALVVIGRIEPTGDTGDPDLTPLTGELARWLLSTKAVEIPDPARTREQGPEILRAAPDGQRPPDYLLYGTLHGECVVDPRSTTRTWRFELKLVERATGLLAWSGTCCVERRSWKPRD